MPIMLIQLWFHANFSVYTLFKIFWMFFWLILIVNSFIIWTCPLNFTDLFWKFYLNTLPNLYHAHMLRKFNIKVLFRERSSCKIKI